MRKLVISLLLICVFVTNAVASPQYTENTPEYISQLFKIIHDEIGETEQADGTSKYGIWAKDPKAQWCAEFLCWCVSTCDAVYSTSLLNNIYPYYTSQNVGRDWFIKKGRYVDRRGRVPEWGTQFVWSTGLRLNSNQYIPKTGDFMFFSYDGTFNTSHVAIVEYVSGDALNGYTVHVVEGNNPDSVARNSYPLDKSQILGYGTYSNEIGTVMRAGNKGDIVETLQKQLCGIDYLNESDITGYYDGKTAKAVAEFQKTMKNKLSNGVADFQTQEQIGLKYDRISDYVSETWLVVD